MESGNDLDTKTPLVSDEDSELIVPLHVEEASVSKRQVETGRVRVSTVTRLHEQLVEELLQREEVQIERKAVNKPITTAPPVREEGDTIVVPVVEEVVVIERRLMLKEEIYIRRVRGTEQFKQTVTLRKQEALVERSPAETSSSYAGSVPDVTSKPEK